MHMHALFSFFLFDVSWKVVQIVHSWLMPTFHIVIMYSDCFPQTRMKYDKVHQIYKRLVEREDVDPTLVGSAVCLSLSLFLCPFVSLSASICLPACLPVCLSVSLFVSLCVSVSLFESFSPILSLFSILCRQPPRPWPSSSLLKPLSCLICSENNDKAIYIVVLACLHSFCLIEFSCSLI